MNEKHIFYAIEQKADHRNNDFTGKSPGERGRIKGSS